MPNILERVYGGNHVSGFTVTDQTHPIGFTLHRADELLPIVWRTCDPYLIYHSEDPSLFEKRKIEYYDKIGVNNQISGSLN